MTVSAAPCERGGSLLVTLRDQNGPLLLSGSTSLCSGTVLSAGSIFPRSARAQRNAIELSVQNRCNAVRWPKRAERCTAGSQRLTG